MNTVTFPSVPNNATFTKTFTYQNSDGTPVDLTGSTLAMQIASLTSGRSVVAIANVTINNASQGQFTVSVTQAQMERVRPGTYSHDLIRTRPDGIAEQVWSGTMIVAQGVTL